MSELLLEDRMCELWMCLFKWTDVRRVRHGGRLTRLSPLWAVCGTRMGPSSSAGLRMAPLWPRVKMVFLLFRDGLEKKPAGESQGASGLDVNQHTSPQCSYVGYVCVTHPRAADTQQLHLHTPRHTPVGFRSETLARHLTQFFTWTLIICYISACCVTWRIPRVVLIKLNVSSCAAAGDHMLTSCWWVAVLIKWRMTEWRCLMQINVQQCVFTSLGGPGE